MSVLGGTDSASAGWPVGGRLTSATECPHSASRRAAAEPAGPPPMTTASEVISLSSCGYDKAPPDYDTGRSGGSTFTDHSPELVSEKKTCPLKGIALHTMVELGTQPFTSVDLCTAISRPCV